jgi:DNA-binding CsgD family transcriptional regulator
LALAYGYRLTRVFFVAGLVLTIVIALDAMLIYAGPDPRRRFVLVGVVLAVWGAACFMPVAVTDALRNWPWLMLGLGAMLAILAAFDGGLLHSPLESEEAVLIGLAVITGGVRRVVGVSAILTVGLVASLPVGYESRELFTEPMLADVVTLWGLTAVVAAFFSVWHRACAPTAAFARLADVRKGEPSLTPALGSAIRGTPMLPAATPARRESLSAAERNVVDKLADGMTAKQIADGSGRSIYTIRSHIRSAKGKTGARTIAQLVATRVGSREHG